MSTVDLTEDEEVVVVPESPPESGEARESAHEAKRRRIGYEGRSASAASAGKGAGAGGAGGAGGGGGAAAASAATASSDPDAATAALIAKLQREEEDARIAQAYASGELGSLRPGGVDVSVPDSR